MKKSRLSGVRRSFAIACASLLTFGAFGAYAANPNQDEVVTLDARWSRYEYKPNEIIVKFKPESQVNMTHSKGRFASSAVTEVDNLLRSLGVENVEALMPLTGAQPVSRKMRAYNGSEVEVKDLSKLYVVKLQATDADANIFEAIEQLEALDEVEFAEPNYIMHALETDFSSEPDDPMYDVQYGLSAIKLDQLWKEPVLEKDGPVIAILDTGVDITHPDLAANIWTNPQEENGSEGYDDDKNGFKDDIHGWDFINNTGDIQDFNGHGTHCAGIAAACGFNSQGIIGANPDAKIMPVAVLQSNGTGDTATVIKGVDYASANGAKIISMSLGSYASSTALEEALGRAYQNAVIVAAAGNDGYCLNHKHPENGQPAPMPMFPGAYTFVLGVQASGEGGGMAGFSNYDDNGATFSEYPESQLYNYELKAPGVSIISTYPGGNYKKLNGTSMATPLVAGALSRLLQTKEYNNWENLFGDLIHTSQSNGVLDIYAAFNLKDEDRRPELQFVGFDMVDENGDGRPDAGEEVEFYPWIRNTWGNVSGIKVSLANNEATVSDIVEILTDEVEFGHSLSSYGKARALNPVKLKVNKDAADGRIVKLKLTAYADNVEPIENEFEITLENGVEIGGVITKDTTLSPENKYIITSNIGIVDNVTLTILPGTILEVRPGLGISLAPNAKLICNGEPNKFITFKQSNTETKGNQPLILGTNNSENVDLSYVIFENFYKDLSSASYGLMAYVTIHDCIFRNISTSILLYGVKGTRLNLFENNGRPVSDNVQITCSNFVNNKLYYKYLLDYSRSNITTQFFDNSSIFNNFYNNENISIAFRPSQPQILTLEPLFFGSSKENIVKKGILDINSGDGYGIVDLSNMLTKPSEEAHGIVWKVLVEGKDAQDEFDDIDPLGVGRYKFEVYFNRKMNTEKAPTIAMGVRAPYTQTAIGEDGAWSEDGKVYTAYLTISGKDDIDGLNRIYVAGAEDDEYFSIPVENYRFNVYVSAAGSMSDEFFATPGLGKVDLTWESSDENIDDVLGYNIYRYTIDQDGNESAHQQINKHLVDETTYTDFEVVPGNAYLYYYKTLRTNMTENSASKVVRAVPLTAQKGDANGSLTIDVVDVVTEVNYIIGENPQPFIFEAADINEDLDINVLDVVGTINIINTLENGANGSAMEAEGVARFTLEDGTLYVESDIPMGGLQVRLNAERGESITPLESFSGFEQVNSWTSDNEYLYMLFSMAGKSISPGRHALLKIGDATVSELVASNVNGGKLDVEYNDDITGIETVEAGDGMRVYPNPFKDVVNINYSVAGDTKVFFVVNNLQGALVASASRQAFAGNNTLTINGANLPAGIYFVQMIVDGKNVKTFKLIKE